MNTQHPQQIPTAIIGMSCLFAKSVDLKAYLHILMRGISGIDDPPPSHSHLMDCLDPDTQKADHIYCNRGGFLPQVEFDPTEFGIPPNTIEATDTSQLLALLTAKSALADAGYGHDGKHFERDKTSVILGVTGTQELVIPLGARLGHPIWRRALQESDVPQDQAEDVIQRISDAYVGWQENSFPGLLGNVVAGRIANRLDLGGTNCVVDAACASSMSAIHMALMELTSGRCDMIITGGVDTINDPFMHMCFSKTQILSLTGEIRPFSKNADGTLLGEGVGLVILKRLEDAQRDKDRIYAVIRGIGSASDGKSQSIYAPRPSGQAKALRKAYAYAGIDPAAVELVEAHGTATRAGDQVEFQTLCDVFGEAAANGNRCALGSVKSNIGHTKAAAGVAGLIKATLSIYHKILPPTLKAEEINPKLGVDHSPFYLNTNLRPWLKSDDTSRKAGVSAFGFGGSNFHMVLEEYQSQEQEPAWDGTVEILTFSGPNADSVQSNVQQWMQKFTEPSAMRHIAYKAAQTRKLFNPKAECRLTIVLSPANDFNLLQKIGSQAAQGPEAALTSDCIFWGTGNPPGKLAFIFPGQGSQYTAMGRDLICCFPQSLNTFQDAHQHFNGVQPLCEIVFPHLKNRSSSEERLRQTQNAQPAIGAVSVSMLKALTYFGIKPDAVCGHSYGELTALHAAGWISQQNLWKLSIARGRLMADAGAAKGDAGTMLAVKAPLHKLEALVQQLNGQVALANRNSPEQGVLSGAVSAIEQAEAECRKRHWKGVRLPVAAAFHSSLVASAQIPFAEMVHQVSITPTDIDVMSNTLGSAYTKNVDEIKHQLCCQLTQPVDFIGNIETLYATGMHTFVEVGPKSVLSSLVHAILKNRKFETLSLDRSAGRQFGISDLAYVLAKLTAMGHMVKLDLWEKSTPSTRTPKMRIPMSGANIRISKPKKKPAPVKSNQAGLKSKEQNAATAAPTGTSSSNTIYNDSKYTNIKTNNTIINSQVMSQEAIMKSNDKTQGTDGALQTDALRNALAVVQQGFASMQALQAQTTQAHQKFLDAQTQASKTLQQMMQSTQHMLAGIDPSTMPLQATPVPTHPDNSLSTVQEQMAASVPQPVAATAVPVQPVQVEPEPHEAKVAPEPLQPAIPEAKTDPCPATQETLLHIVSELTGYPVEMLGMQMDIEADLGIDSIKRVEILSALEEKLPHLPKVTPEHMGSLKTLGQICDYLTAESDSPASAVTLSDASPTPSVNTDATQETLLHIVSELTGYPVEMLGMQMDIEADLGIDSIKRVEILSALEEKLPHLPKVTPEHMGSLKTLSQITAFLTNETEPDKPLPPSTMKTETEILTDTHQAIQRCIVQVVPAPIKAQQERLTMAHGHFIGITPDSNGLAQTLIHELKAFNYDTRPLTLEDAQALALDAGLAGLIIIAPQAPAEAFQFAHVCAPLLMQSAQNSMAFFSTITALDGAFGFNANSITEPIQGALAGLVKTASKEWPAVRCKALDLDPKWNDQQAIARAVAAELVQSEAESHLEIGLSATQRIILQTVKAQCPQGRIELKEQEVVLVTGGARGITAACAKALSDFIPCRLALVGRSPVPVAEPQWLTTITDLNQMKKAILAKEFQGTSPSPMQLEKTFQRWTANRQINDTLTRLNQGHTKALYFQADLCDERATRNAIKRITREIGPIKAVIHGAGVLEDSLIVDKRLQQFERVFSTKVQGLKTVLNALNNTELRYLILFSSVSARLGNKGQADYAMANEVLNKIAWQQSYLHPDCKVVAINWGPWNGGMVTPVLKRNFEKMEVPLISMEQGAQAMVTEMAAAKNQPAEVVIGGLFQHTTEQPGQRILPAHSPSELFHQTMSLTCKREIDVARYPVLQSHQLDGRPVVPLALIAEWLAHSALHANPGLKLHGIDHLRLLSGIALDQQTKLVRMMAGKVHRKDDVYEVDVQIRNGVNGDREVIHSSAKAILTDTLPPSPPFKENGHFKTTDNAETLNDIYDRILFHGQALHGIRKIVRLNQAGMTAMLAAAPSPRDWIAEPLRSSWIADPLVLDSAFQMATIWCHEHLGVVSLPSFAASYRQYCRQFPSDGVAAILDVRQTTNRKMVGDFTFLDRNKKVVARLTGYKAVMDKSLFKAFSKNKQNE